MNCLIEFAVQPINSCIASSVKRQKFDEACSVVDAGAVQTTVAMLQLQEVADELRKSLQEAVGSPGAAGGSVATTRVVAVMSLKKQVKAWIIA